MLIECSYCQSRVDGAVAGEVIEHEADEHQLLATYKISLLKCPVCKNALVGQQQEYQSGPDSYDWTPATRVFPDPETGIDLSIPSSIQKSLFEAKRCFRAQAYSACAVMCGRAIEAMCRAHMAAAVPLARGLIALRDAGVIDGRLYEWGESLREERNIGAHDAEATITAQDARDVLDFATAICEYVYILSDQHSRYLARKKAKSAAGATPLNQPSGEESADDALTQ